MGLSDDDALRVLVVSPFGTSAVSGGAEKWLAGMLEHLPMISWRVLLLQPGPFEAELHAAGIDVRVHPTGASAPSVARAALRTSGVLRRWRPDVVVGNGVKAQLVATLATVQARTPTVWVKHDYSFDRTLARPLGRLSGTVVATAAEVGHATRRDDTVVIHPPVQATSPLGRGRARARLAERGVTFDDRPVLAMAGRLVPYKGIDDAVGAIAAPDADGWRLVVVGDEDHSAPGERERLAQLSRDRGVVDRVTFVDPLPDLGDLFAAFDALAVLTKPVGRRTPGREGFGMTAFEAMQAGTPVIAVVGSPVAHRLGGRAGITVPPGDPVEVAAALARLSDPGTRRDMGLAGQDLVRGYPGAEEAARAFSSVLHAAAGSGTRSGAR